jgi:class 3 adenylate cyclase
VGIHSGVALVGNIGSADKMEYTALGDTVNMASRLESLNKEHKTRLLMSEATHLMLDGALDTMCLGEVVVRGTSAPMKIFTLPDLMSGAPEAVASGKTS